MAEGPVSELRVAVTVEDYEAAVRFHRDALGLQVIEGVVETPWRHPNVRLRAPDGIQLTLFTVLDE